MGPVHLLASALAAAPANTGQDAVALEWRAPAECPDAQTVLGWVDGLTPPTGSAREVPQVRAEIATDAAGYVVTLAIDAHDHRVQRSLHADDCVLLARAAAVLIAVSLDPLAVAESVATPRPEATSLPVPEQEPAPAPAPDPDARLDPPDPVPTQRRRRSSSIEYGAAIGIGVGGLLLPSAGAGLVLAPFVGTRRIHVEGALQYWLPRRTAVDDDARDLGAVLQLVTGGVRVCPIVERGRVRIPLCAGIDVGGVLASGSGADLRGGRDAAAPWTGVVLAPAVRLAVAPRISLGLGIEGVLSLYRPRFAIRGLDDDVWVAGAGGIRGVFTVQVHARRKPRSVPVSRAPRR